MRRPDYIVWEQKFLPLKNENGDIKKFESFGKDWEEVKFLAGKNCQFLWTIVECEDKWYLSRGYHLVNRIGFVITKNPWNNRTRDYKLC